MGRSEQDRLMDEANEMLDDARSILSDAVNLLDGANAELVDASDEMCKEFGEQVREMRRQAAATRNDPKRKVPVDEPVVSSAPDPAQWKKTDPLKLLRVTVTGRQNFKVLFVAAFKVLLSRKATFLFRKPINSL